MGLLRIVGRKRLIRRRGLLRNILALPLDRRMGAWAGHDARASTSLSGRISPKLLPSFFSAFSGLCPAESHLQPRSRPTYLLQTWAGRCCRRSLLLFCFRSLFWSYWPREYQIPRMGNHAILWAQASWHGLVMSQQDFARLQIHKPLANQRIQES